jgi:hypothetical protein
VTHIAGLAASAGLVLAAALVSFLALSRARALLAMGGKHTHPGASETAIELLQQKLETLEHELVELRRVGAPAPISPRAGLNLDKRSQVLRMHRRGEQPARIAAFLEVPQPEVELLIKVHRIVLSSI